MENKIINNKYKKNRKVVFCNQQSKCNYQLGLQIVHEKFIILFENSGNKQISIFTIEISVSEWKFVCNKSLELCLYFQITAVIILIIITLITVVSIPLKIITWNENEQRMCLLKEIFELI